MQTIINSLQKDLNELKIKGKEDQIENSKLKDKLKEFDTKIKQLKEKLSVYEADSMVSSLKIQIEELSENLSNIERTHSIAIAIKQIGTLTTSIRIMLEAASIASRALYTQDDEYENENKR